MSVLYTIVSIFGVIAAISATVCIAGYIEKKIPDEAYKTIGKVIFRCRIQANEKAPDRLAPNRTQ